MKFGHVFLKICEQTDFGYLQHKDTFPWNLVPNPKLSWLFFSATIVESLGQVRRDAERRAVRLRQLRIVYLTIFVQSSKMGTVTEGFDARLAITDHF